MKATTAVSWSDNQDVRSLIAVYQLVKSNDLGFVLVNFGRLTERFYEKALDQNYRCSLTVAQNLELETEFAALADWIQSAKEGVLKHKLQVKIKLQINMLQTARYILVKGSKFPRDYHWTCNVIKLALETAIYCHDAKLWTEMEWCLNETEFYQHSFIQRWHEIPFELRAPYLLDSYLLPVLRLLWIHGCKIDDDEALDRCVTLFDVMELSPQQTIIIAKICFNVGLDRFHRQKYEMAATWLKISYRYAISNLSRNKRVRTSPSKTLYLMAICLYKADVLQNRDKILRILDLAGETLAIAELRFRTLMQGKPQLPHLVRSALKLLCIHVNQDLPNFRTNVLKVFMELERNGHSQVTVDMLNAIPWHTGSRSALDVTIVQDLMPHIKWICAEVAIRLCIQRKFLSGCYLWLEELSQWTPSRNINSESMKCIFALAEAQAINLKSHYLALKWFQTLAKISRIHGGPSSVVANAIRYSLSLNSDQGLLAAKQIFDSGIPLADLDIQLLRFRLLVAALDEDLTKANETCLELDVRYKKEENLEADSWEEGLHTLELCAMVALKNHKMNEVVSTCLDAMINEIRKGEISQIVRVIRFHVKILFHPTMGYLENAGDHALETAKCIDNLISTLLYAYRELKESIESPDGPHDGNGLELWFGNLAWSLGRKLGCIMPGFSRHQFYKLSYKLLSLTSEKDQDINDRIAIAITMAVAIGINCLDHQHYHKILGICRDVIEEFPKKGTLKPIQLHFYEFYILCELGEIKRMWELLRQYEANDGIKSDPNFFEALAALASNASQKFLRQILPPVESHQLPSVARERNQNLQVKLSCVAIHCLKISNRIQAKFSQPLPIDRMALNWKRIIELSSEYISLRENNMDEHRILCEEYRLFIVENRQQFNSTEVSLFFNYVWNVTVETRIFKGTKAANRWLDILKNVSSLSVELQKQFRSLLKDLEYKCSNGECWN
ncbi:uncharacterized protein LOC124188446 [Daphnia pulex]|uniref:uncharacterized protein LOC124188446 n=1 Tax=Daphnia pulex TaxID=6669 RepID=UPI001EE038E9|nr:uncharacterized protein LOC124188446 [Daphnia pulex]